VTLVGYTNAGKSSMLNALTNAGVVVEDRSLRPWIRVLDNVNFPAVKPSSSLTPWASSQISRTNWSRPS